MLTFSIIIPTFNSGSTLRASLDSIVLQEFKDVEVFIQDGLSDDDTLEIAASYQDKLPHLVVISEKDKGIYDAMNKALDKSRGEWVIFMGSDDCFYDKNVLKTVTSCIARTKAKVIYGNAKIIGDTGWAKDGDTYDGEFDIHKLLNQNICHQAIFYNREFIIKEVGDFNLDYKKSSDWDFNLRCWAKQPFEFMNLIIANFMAGGFSTNSNDKKISEDFLVNVLKYFNINPFHSLVNNPNFIFYYQVLKKQQQEYPFRYKIEILKRRIAKKLNRK